MSDRDIWRTARGLIEQHCERAAIHAAQPAAALLDGGMAMSGTKGVRRGRTIKNDGPDLIDVHVGHQLRKARLLAKLNQVGLGNGIGVSFQAVQKYEAGENRLSASRLHMAAQFLRLPVSFFFEGMGADVGAVSGGAFSAKEVELIRAFRDVDDQALRTAIVELIGTIGNLVGRRGAWELPSTEARADGGQRDTATGAERRREGESK